MQAKVKRSGIVRNLDALAVASPRGGAVSYERVTPVFTQTGGGSTVLGTYVLKSKRGHDNQAKVKRSGIVRNLYALAVAEGEPAWGGWNEAPSHPLNLEP